MYKPLSLNCPLFIAYWVPISQDENHLSAAVESLVN